MKPGLKALTAIAAVAAALLSIVALITLPWAPLKPIVRHVNPAAEAEQTPLPTFMALLVTGALDSLIGGNYTAAADMLKTIGAAYIPEKYRFVIDRFTQLMNRISDLLSGVEQLLDQAEALIAVGKGEDAKVLLDEASLKLASANVTYTELRGACDELAKTFSLPMGELRSRVDELGRVISQIRMRLLRLLEMIERQTTLEDSFLTIDVTPKTVWTGGSILVSGRLYAASGGLGGRSVQVYVDGVKLAEATTLGGEFTVQASIPYIYKPKVAVQARYTPLGLDSQTYRPSTSNTVEVSLLYIKPRITAEAVGEALPGKAFTLKGRVEADGPLPYPSVKVSWAGAVLKASLKDGGFEMPLYTPENLPDGEYALTVEAPAWQVYAPAETTVQVRVYRLPINVRLQPPTIVFAGIPSALKGEIIYGSERFNVTVRAVFAGQAYTTSSNGEFSIGLTVPLTVLTGYQSYEVYVSPELPWYSNVALSGSIMIINPFMLLVSVGLVSTLSLKLLRGRGVEGAKPEGSHQEQAARHPAAEKEHFVPSDLEWLMDLYWQAVSIVVDLTGVEMKPSMTMREYLSAAGPWLGGLKASLEALTEAAERAVYSPAVPSSWLESARKAFEELALAYVSV